MTFFKNVESVLKDYSSQALKQLEHYYAIDLELIREVKDTHTDVYGSHAGNKGSKVADFRGVLVSDDFFPSSPAYAGNFQEGFLYTSFTSVLVGDIVAIKSSDKKIRRFFVESFESIGTQETVFYRYKLSNLGN
jgi:hypothetical protein